MKNLTSAQASYIRNNFSIYTVLTRLDGKEKLVVEPFIKGKYPYAKITLITDNGYPLPSISDMCFLRQGQINLAGIKLNFANAANRFEHGNTIFTFSIKGQEFQSHFLNGELDLVVPGDVMSVINDSSNFDCQKYDSFMNEFLPKQIEYFRIINKDDIIAWSSSMLDDKQTLSITIKLQTGKGYSSHLHTCDYNFYRDDYYYECDRPLYDKDYEAQIVRKFVRGLDFCQSGTLPEYIQIHIIQELD